MFAAQTKKVWMDGKLVESSEAKIHVLSHTFHYGVGVFEGIRCYPTDKGPAIFRLKDHVHRLATSAKIYHMPVPYSEEEMVQAISETQAANDIVPSYIRPIVYRGEPALGVKNDKGKISLAIAAIPAKKYLGEESERGVRAKVSPFRKPHSDAIPSFSKADGNYLNSYLAGIDAARDGYEEAILLDQNGYVAEGTGENIFLVRDGTVYTPGLESDILLGITRASVLQIAKDLGYPVVQKLLSMNELLTADEAFFSGTYAEVAPIREISHYMVGEGKPGPVTRDIMDVFNRAVHGQEPKYASWLHLVGAVVRPVPRAARRPAST
ncbi:MAG TPA: branched-chain amino acid transaminase [Thermoplasmata archaeon]|nr:branched-chain amino acid transaminase [Thermoplasmata archaeon]